MEVNKKINTSIKLYPIFYALSADSIFYIPIDTLFLTMVKGLNASQISAITMIGLIVCIVSQRIIVNITKHIGNTNSVRLGSLMLLLSMTILTFGNSFATMVVYKIINEFANMFWSMTNILLRNDLIEVNKENEYFAIRNKGKVMYGEITMITALLAGHLYNINNYIPMYISIGIYLIVFILSFKLYEKKIEQNKQNINESRKVKISSLIFLVILSNAMFYTIIKLGQSNSKLFMQYDFQKVLTVEMVAYYITIIVFLSRIIRIIGNILFGKLYLKIKDKISIVLTILECIAFLLLILGHFITFSFALKVVVMSLGFFCILAVRDSFRIYIEDTALKITKREEHQKVMINIEVYRKLGQLILSGAFTLILIKYDLIVIEIILLLLSIVEVIINKEMIKRIIFNNNEFDEDNKIIKGQ